MDKLESLWITLNRHGQNVARTQSEIMKSSKTISYTVTVIPPDKFFFSTEKYSQLSLFRLRVSE